MKVVVLAGGISTERDVSLSTGKTVYKAIKAKGHKAIILDAYFGLETDTENIFDKDIDWAERIGSVSEVNPDLEAVKALRNPEITGYFGPNVIKLCKEADVVYMALHGENGENGRIQATFDLEGIRYTGTDYLSSAMCMNKQVAKEMMAYNGIPVPKGIHIEKGQNTDNTIGYPCVVKACCGGSSVGVSIARDAEEYDIAVKEAFKYDTQAVVEQYIKGREFSIGVVDGKAYPVIEIAPLAGFYDYKNKYQAGSTVETCPAKLEENKTKEMQHYAENAFKALRLRDYARMDFMMSEDGKIYCLEANTLPGMTPTSLLPQEAAAIGIDFEQLVENIINLAMNR